MRPYRSLAWIVTTGVLAALVLVADASAEDHAGARAELRTPDPSGVLGSLSTRGAVVDRANPFFQSLGTNGRACATCHVPDQAWTISPPEVRRRFEQTGGTDPLFRPNDGAVSPNADVSTLGARRQAYRLLLHKGVIRVGLGLPAGAQFELVGVDDPYGFASATELSLFRRPLPSTNLAFLNAVMWDGRETLQPLLPGASPAQNLAALQVDLRDQANGATRGHAQAARDLTEPQRQQIVDFELGLSTAQLVDAAAGRLSAHGAAGGPEPLAQQPFFIGINDLVLSGDKVEPPNPSMTLFRGWAQAADAERRAVARGEAIFNARPVTISGVAGLNDALGRPSLQGTCSTCHNAPNVGDHSTAAPLDIGVADASRRTPDLPLYTLRNRATGQTVQTTDPGRALVTGQWADIGKFKGPVLRGLAARAPYFHNGAAADLDQVVDFYNSRFSLGLSGQDHHDLVAFLRSL
jgi:cytochrome c peroxidase